MNWSVRLSGGRVGCTFTNVSMCNSPLSERPNENQSHSFLLLRRSSALSPEPTLAPFQARKALRLIAVLVEEWIYILRLANASQVGSRPWQLRSGGSCHNGIRLGVVSVPMLRERARAGGGDGTGLRRGIDTRNHFCCCCSRPARHCHHSGQISLHTVADRGQSVSLLSYAHFQA